MGIAPRIGDCVGRIDNRRSPGVPAFETMIEPGFSNGTMRVHRNASLALARPTYLAKDFNQKLKNEERVDERNDKAHCFPDFKSSRLGLTQWRLKYSLSTPIRQADSPSIP